MELVSHHTKFKTERSGEGSAHLVRGEILDFEIFGNCDLHADD